MTLEITLTHETKSLFTFLYFFIFFLAVSLFYLFIIHFEVLVLCIALIPLKVLHVNPQVVVS